MNKREHKNKRRWLVLLTALAAALAMLFAACADDTPTPPGGDDDVKTSYSLSATSLSLGEGERATLTVSPAPGADTAVVWATSDKSVATVDGGEVTAVREGSATVTCKIGDGDPLSCAVTVTEAAYRLSYTALSLGTLTGSSTAKIEVYDRDGNAAGGGIEFTSSDTGIVTVSGDGTVTAVGRGKATVSVKVDGHTLVCDVTVRDGYEYSLGVTEKYLAEGARFTLTCGGNPDAVRTFQSSDSQIASVDPASGEVTAIAAGEAEITCKVDGIALDCKVYVSKYTIDGVNVMNGGTAKIEITTQPAGRDVSDATFTPADDTVVSVDADGTVHGLKIDNTTVTVNVGGKNFTVAVNVVGSFGLTNDRIELVLGRTAVGEETLGLVGVTASELTFTSGDESVATVDATGKITAVSVGECKVTGTSKTNPEDKVVATVKVVMPEVDADLSEVARYSEFNLSHLDDAYATLDYKYYHGSAILKKKGGNLIGNYSATATPGANNDYQSGIWFTDGEVESGSVPMYGSVFADHSIRTVAGSYEVPVSVNKNVTKLVIFTGAWDNSANVTLTLDGELVASTSFESSKRYVKVEFALDPSGLKTGDTVDAVIKVERVRASGGNLDMVAVAVIGDGAHADSSKAEIAAGANAESNYIDDSSTIDLTGDSRRADWVFANSNDNFGDHRAATPEGAYVETDDIVYSGVKSTGDHHPSKFGWTDGTKSATRSNASSFLHTPNYVVIPVSLPAGKYTVRLYVSAWKAMYNAVCVDSDGKFVGSVQCATAWTGNSAAYEVIFPLDVKEAGTFEFHLLNQVRDGNLGWTAIAIDNENGYKLTNGNVALALGGNVSVPAPELAAIGTQPAAPSLKSVRIVSEAPATGTGSVLRLNQNTLTAAGAGTATVAYTFGNFTLYGYVTVAKYELKESSVNLQPGQKYTPELTVTPAGAVPEFTVTLSSGEDKVSVSGKEITAIAAGTTTVTVNAGGARLTLNVTVLDYKLAEESGLIKDGEIVVKLDNGNVNAKIAALSVESNGQKHAYVSFASNNENVVTVTSAGEVTARGAGEATVTAKVLASDNSETGTALTVKVKLYTDLTVEKTDVAQTQSVNLSTVGGTKKTLDWQYYGADGHGDRMYGSAGLIGETNAASASFWDYGPDIMWNDGMNGAITTYGRSDGVVYYGSGTGYCEFTVKVNGDVDHIRIYTGAWHAKNVLTVGMFGKQVATADFSNNSSSEANWKNVCYDVRMGDYVKGEVVLTVRLAVATQDDGWSDNISLIAVAVVGKDDKESGSTQTTVSVTKTRIDSANKGTTPIVLSDGTDDWWYSHCENDPSTKKDTDNHIIIGTNATSRLEGGNYRYESKTWAFDAVFNWTGGDGNHPTHYNDNDTHVSIPGTDNVYEGQEHSLGFVLPEGTHTIVLYVRSWNAKGYVAVCDKFGAEVGRQVLNDGDDNLGQGSCYAVTCTVTVGAQDAGYYAVNLVVTGGSNFGLAAVTVTL